MDSSPLIAAAGTLAGVALGFVGNLVTSHLRNLKADRARAGALLAQVVSAVSTFQVEVDSFLERRASRRAQILAAVQALAGIAASWREGNWLRGGAEELRYLRSWDLAEGDRLVGRFQPSLAELYPALILLGLMDSDIGERADQLAQEVGSYASAKDDGERRDATSRISAALGELGNAVRLFVGRKWWHRRRSQRARSN